MLLAIALVSCSNDNSDANVFFLAPDQAFAKVESCEHPHQFGVIEQTNCEAAINAVTAIKQELHSIVQNPKAYGSAIMRLQQEIDTLQQQLEDADLTTEQAEAITTKLAQTNDILRHHYAMLRLTGE